MTELAPIIAGLLVLVGSFFALVAVISLWRLTDIYTRSHAASKTGTLGSGLVLLGFVVLHQVPGPLGIVGICLVVAAGVGAARTGANPAWLPCAGWALRNRPCRVRRTGRAIASRPSAWNFGPTCPPVCTCAS